MNKPTGELSLVFSRKDNGRTHLSRQYFKLPLQIMMPHYQEEDGTAFVYFLNPGGGILQHDRLLTEVTVEDGADVFITTPSCTKFYRMDEGHAEVENIFSVGSGATLEYLPEYNVPFAQSSSFQDSVFRLKNDSVLIASDIVTAGRTSRNEIFDYDIYSSKTRIYVDDELKLYDSCRITPETMDPARRGLLEGKLSSGTVYAYAPNTCVLSPSWVIICLSWTSLTPWFGKKTIISVPGTSANPSSAAFPVSPDVAVRMQIFLSSFSFFIAVVSRYGSIDSAISLKAAVLP